MDIRDIRIHSRLFICLCATRFMFNRALESLRTLPPWIDPLAPDEEASGRELSERQAAAQQAAALAERLVRAEPRRWASHCLQGQALWEAGRRGEALVALATGCRLGADVEGGLIEPIYQLHAARATAVLEGRGAAGNATDDEALRAAQWLAFEAAPGSDAVAAAQGHQPGQPGSESAAVLSADEVAILRDALAAMRWCLHADKYYHKASTMCAGAFDWWLIGWRGGWRPKSQGLAIA